MENVEKIDASVVGDALQMHFYDWFLLRLIPWEISEDIFLDSDRRAVITWNHLHGVDALQWRVARRIAAFAIAVRSMRRSNRPARSPLRSRRRCLAPCGVAYRLALPRGRWRVALPCDG